MSQSPAINPLVRFHPSAGDGEAEYFRQSEEAWQMYQGAAARFSSLDFAELDSWQQAGIPLSAVLLGVMHTFEHFHAGPGRQRIRKLAYCYPEVLRAWNQLST